MMMIDDETNELFRESEQRNWKNVQEPIRQMFLSLSKAIRIQAAGIRDLDRKMTTEYVTNDSLKRVVSDISENTCSKEDGTQLIFQMETKAKEKDFLVLEHRVEQVNTLLSPLYT
jgi:hypothetical protein